MTKQNYYNPPDEWKYKSVRKKYISLTKSLNVVEPINTDFEGINNNPIPSDLIKLKHLLLALSDGIKKSDKACIEIAVEFVTTPVYFHYSGFIRATMARRLKSINLTNQQILKMRVGIYNLFKSKKCGPEQKEFVNFLRKKGFGEQKKLYFEFKGHYIGEKLFKNT